MWWECLSLQGSVAGPLQIFLLFWLGLELLDLISTVKKREWVSVFSGSSFRRRSSRGTGRNVDFKAGK